MDALRVVARESVSLLDPCCRCQAEGCHWDRLGGQPFCPDCQEALAQGHADPLALRTEPRPCVLCGYVGAVAYLTSPLGAPAPIEMDLCARHFRALLSRRLDPHAFARFRQRLAAVGLSPRSVFLLHEAFYDERGHALKPAVEVSE
jgi:hypothetical protein